MFLRWRSCSRCLNAVYTADSILNSRFEFHKRNHLFIRPHNETLSVAAMRVNNPDRSPARINCRDPAQAPAAFLEIIRMICNRKRNRQRRRSSTHQRSLCRDRSMRPQFSKLMQWQRMVFFKSSCILFRRAIWRSSSSNFFRASRRHRAEAGVPLRKPWKRNLISAIVNPAFRANSMMAK